ncbi:MAG: hypothetical protein AAF645_23165, partial [Myxococcota bacterium]
EELSLEVDLTEASTQTIVAGHGAEVEDGVVRLRQSDVRPRADFVLELDDVGARPAQVAWRAPHRAPLRDPNAGAMPDEDEDDYLYVPLRLPDSLFENAGGETGANAGLNLVVVADVSAATEGRELELGRGFVESLAAHLGENDQIAIVASDVGLRGSAELGAASPERVNGLLEALAREPSGGASDLGRTFEQAAALASAGERKGVVIYVGDGAPTVGETASGDLLERIERLPSALRAYAVAVGGESALDLLASVTRGGGMALRVETLSGGAEAALRILGHARRPAAQRVRIELSADQVFPRRPVDVVQGAVLPVVARASEATPTTIRVRGEVGGAAFDEVFDLTEQRIVDEGDLRLRWAGERLRQLLLGGGRREEVADLGVRYGLITPFTSFYVPSAAEMARLGDRAPWSDSIHARNALRTRERPVPAMAAPLLGLLSMTGCTYSAESEAPMGSVDESNYEGGNVRPTSAAAPPEEVAMEESELDYEPEPEPEAVAPAGTPMAPPPPVVQAQGAPTAAANERNEPLGNAVGSEVSADRSLALRGTGRGGGGSGEGTIGLGNLGTIGRGARDDAERAQTANGPGFAGDSFDAPAEPTDDSGQGYGQGYADAAGEARPRPRRSRRRARGGSAMLGGARTSSTETQQPTARAAEQARSGLLPDALLNGATGANRRISASITVNVTPAPRHVRQRCSDASRAFLEERRTLWNERLGAASGPAGYVDLYRRAGSACELRSWRDRRAFLDLMLRRAGNVRTRIQLHRALSRSQDRNHVRRAVLRSVRTPADLRFARNYFGRSYDETLRNQVLERAGSGAGRVRALRQLIAQFEGDITLKLMLLETLEQLERNAQAKRLARALRRDPLTDPGVRTAIGEMYLRFGDEAEARRVFGEIVEFAPDDALARRRLGDLFRAHGWYEDAYRQYQTLATITPDDPSVLLLLAGAAAGAGRV